MGHRGKSGHREGKGKGKGKRVPPPPDSENYFTSESSTDDTYPEITNRRRGQSTHKEGKGKRVPSLTDFDTYSSSASPTDDKSPERNKRTRRRNRSSRNARRNEELLTCSQENEILQLLKLLSTESKGINEMRKQVEKVLENQNVQRKELEKVLEKNKELQKVLENQNVQMSKEFEKVHKQLLELQTNGTSHASDALRSQSNQLQAPKYRLVFTSGNIDIMNKGQPIDISVALIEGNNNQTVENGPLASATVELVVVDAEFNKHDNQYNWSRKDFECYIKKPRHKAKEKRDVDQLEKSIVRKGRFDLVRGVRRHIDSTIFENSNNGYIRLGVMVVSPTEERVLEGLSNSFKVQGHGRRPRQNNLSHNSSKRQRQASVDNNDQEQNLPHMSRINLTQTAGNGLDTSGGKSLLPSLGNSNMFSAEPSNSQEQQALIPQCKDSHLERLAQAKYTQYGPAIFGEQPQLSFPGTSNMLSTNPSTGQEPQALVSPYSACELLRATQPFVGQNGQAPAYNGYPEQNSPMPNLQHLSQINSTRTAGNRWAIFGGQSQLPSPGISNMLSTDPSTGQEPQALVSPYSAWQAPAYNGYPEQNSPMPNLQHPSQINSTRTAGNGPAIFGEQSFPENSNMLSTEPSTGQELQASISAGSPLLRVILGQNDTQFNTYPTTLAVQLVWDRPNVELSKRHWNLLDQLMPLTKFNNCGLPTTRLMQEHLDPLTIISKEVMQTRRNRGVIIEPLEPDDSDEERQLKRKMCSKYQLRFVNKVCEAYHTRDPIKADDGSLLKVALFHESTKITYGPLSSASVQIVVLHGDFNDHGQDYWTSEEFSRYEVCPQPGEETSSVLGGDCILDLADGEACLGDAFFQMTSHCARTGKFKMGVKLASAQEERIQEGVSEPFWVKDHHFEGECGHVTGIWPEDDTARINHPLVVQATIADLVTGPLLYTLKKKASCYRYKVMEGMENLCKILEFKLPAILDIIQDAENKGAFHTGVAAWLKRLKTVSYEVNDIFDECNYEALRREAKKGHHNKLGTEIGRFLVPARNPILCRYRMDKKLRRIVQTIETLVTEMNTFGFRHLQQAPPSRQWQQTDSKIIDSDKDIVSRSRDKEKKKIVGMLLDEASNIDLMVLPIIGMGGLGKTTLVQLIYNDPAIVKHFVLRRWCCVSDDFDVGTIASNICQTSDRTHGKALQELQSIITGKRYLIVLDDVWNRDEVKWGKLMSCLKHGGKGSAILTTTRDAEVAQIMKMGVSEAYTIQKLSPEHLKEIVQSRAFSLQKPNIDELDDIVDMFVDRFAGSPLAAKTLGSVLSTKASLKEWKDISAKSNICSEETGILPILKLSYEDLQSHMKQCFAYCAIFPKHYKIDKESLIQMWIANDFIPVQEGDLPETAGEKVFKELTWRSFFEQVKKTSPIEYGKSLQLRNGTVFTMHDLIHDLALDVMGEKCVTIVDKPSMKKLWPNPSHCVLDDFSKKQFPALRTLFCVDHASSLHMAKYTSLRAPHIPQLEQGIRVSHLRCLRYLNLSRNLELKELPEDICMLYNLQTLDLSHCQHIRQLPKSMKHMSSLRHLYTNGCISLKCMPSGLGQITSLQTLTYFVVGAGLDCSTISELQNLNLCGELEVNCLENATDVLAKAASLENKERLTHLSLQWNSDGQEEPLQDCPKKVLCALRPPASLQMLRVVSYKGNSLPSWTTDPSRLQLLTELHLLGFVSCEEFPPFCQFKVLQILYLEKLDKLKSLCSHVPPTPFPELRELRLHDLKNLEKWVAAEGKELTFPVLEKVDIKNCPKLTCLPEVPILKHIELDEGRSLVFSATVKSRQMSSLSMLALSTHDIEVTTHHIDKNNESSLSELSLKGLPHEDKDISHSDTSNPQEGRKLREHKTWRYATRWCRNIRRHVVVAMTSWGRMCHPTH